MPSIQAVSLSANIPLPTNTFVPLIWSEVIYTSPSTAPGGGINNAWGHTGTDTATINVPADGMYTVTATILLDPNGSGDRELSMRWFNAGNNSTTPDGKFRGLCVKGSSATYGEFGFTRQWFLYADRRYEVCAWQNSGVSLGLHQDDIASTSLTMSQGDLGGPYYGPGHK